MDLEPDNTATTGETLTIDTTNVSFPPNSGPSTGTNTPTGRKTPVKPALKSSSSMDDDDTDGESGEEQQKRKALKKKKKNRTLKWDEAKIQEHDQLRGTRMKIDEPNTPFAHYDSGSETDGSVSSHKRNAHHKISWDALTNKLDAHAAAVALYPPSSPSSHGGLTTDDEDDRKERQRKELKRLEFQEHRKRHYNEMEVVRRFRRDHPDGVPTLNGHNSEDDDEDHDGDDEEE